MDTSKEYIKMCEAAEEIQDYYGKKENREGKALHYFFRAAGGYTTGLIFLKRWYSDSFREPDNNTKMVWLPSQDHLQDVCPGSSIFEVLNDFHLFVFGNLTFSRGFAQFTTAEQLWLVFLMYTTLQKRWNGEKWEKM